MAFSDQHTHSTRMLHERLQWVYPELPDCNVEIVILQILNCWPRRVMLLMSSMCGRMPRLANLTS